jgi:hypothetical protein
LRIFYAVLLAVCSERDSSGTTEAAKGGEGDGADSPTRAGKAREAARPTNFASQNLIKN